MSVLTYSSTRLESLPDPNSVPLVPPLVTKVRHARPPSVHDALGNAEALMRMLHFAAPCRHHEHGNGHEVRMRVSRFAREVTERLTCRPCELPHTRRLRAGLGRAVWP